jgi:hypothetical protein
MINKTTLTLVAAIAVSSIALPAAALAQSAYTSGTAASSEAAGYPTPYGNGGSYRGYAPDYDRSYVDQDRRQRGPAESER